jgi:hypothetical protein
VTLGSGAAAAGRLRPIDCPLAVAAQSKPPRAMPSGWQPFLDDSIIGVGLLHGAILSHTGDTLVASDAFSVDRDQALKLLEVLHRAGAAAAAAAEAEVRASGFKVSGVRYALTRADTDEDSDCKYIIGRCKELDEPARGIIVCLTYQALIVAVHDPLHSPDLSFGKANVAITVLAEALMAQDY